MTLEMKSIWIDYMFTRSSCMQASTCSATYIVLIVFACIQSALRLINGKPLLSAYNPAWNFRLSSEDDAHKDFKFKYSGGRFQFWFFPYTA